MSALVYTTARFTPTPWCPWQLRPRPRRLLRSRRVRQQLQRLHQVQRLRLLQQVRQGLPLHQGRAQLPGRDRSAVSSEEHRLLACRRRTACRQPEVPGKLLLRAYQKLFGKAAEKHRLTACAPQNARIRDQSFLSFIVAGGKIALDL